MRALDRKLLRDLWRLRGPAVAIALVMAAAISIAMLSAGTQRSLEETRAVYYERYRFAELFASVRRAPEHVALRIRDIPGVVRVQTRIVGQALLDMPGVVEPVRAALVSVPERGEPALNALALRAGRFVRPDRHDEAVVHEAFAEAHRLRPGDSIAATINGRRRTLAVVGIALSPEFVYALGPGDLVPDNRRFGVLWLGRDALAAAYDLKGAFNDVVVQLRRSVSESVVISRMDVLLAPYGGAGAFGRRDHLSDAFIDSEINQLATLTRVVPPIFLAVAAFLVNLVLSRLVETERGQIGLLKAFGYSSAAIGWTYVRLALAIAAIGIGVGWGAGAWLGRIVTELYTEYFRFPLLQYRLSLPVMAMAAAVGLAAALAGALLAVRRAVRLAPAVAMAPPAPPAYRRGLADRLGLAGDLRPVGRMVLRHVARFPLRSLFTTVGVALAAAQLVSTLFFIDAIDEMMQSFFFRTQHQDITLRLADPRADAVLHDLARLPGVRRVELRRSVPVRLTLGPRSERSAIIGFEPDALLSQRADAEGRAVALPEEGLVLTAKLAADLDARPGDLVTVAMLSGRRDVHEIAVSRIVAEYVGALAYMSRPALNRLLREGPVADGADLLVDEAQQAALFRAVKDTPVVQGITVRTTATRLFREAVDQHMLTMVTIYILFASVIAVGVLYNSARIILAERARELALLRMMGYATRDVAMILAGELLLLTVLALPLGCAGGYGLAALMAHQFSTDLYRLPLVISPATYGLAVTVVLAAACLTAAGAARRLAWLDLVAALKVRE